MGSHHHQARGVLADAALGALAGAAATWVMGRTTEYLYEHEGPATREAENAARGDKTAAEVAAEKLGGVLGREWTAEQRRAVGSAIHWGLGTGVGALYGVLRPRAPGIDAGQGTAFGTAFWLVVDEAANPALGLTPGPRAFPWQAHARGLAGHLVYGVVTDTVLDAADRVM